MANLASLAFEVFSDWFGYGRARACIDVRCFNGVLDVLVCFTKMFLGVDA